MGKTITRMARSQVLISSSKWFTGLSIIFFGLLIVIATKSLKADEFYVCDYKQQSIGLEYESENSSLPCDISLTEDNSTKTLWTAKFTPNFCSNKLWDILELKQSLGFNCELDISIFSSGKDEVYSCKLFERRINIQYADGISELPCTINYQKSSGSSILWTAKNDSNFCKNTGERFIAKQESFGFRCSKSDNLNDRQIIHRDPAIIFGDGFKGIDSREKTEPEPKRTKKIEKSKSKQEVPKEQKKLQNKAQTKSTTKAKQEKKSLQNKAQTKSTTKAEQEKKSLQNKAQPKSTTKAKQEKKSLQNKITQDKTDKSNKEIKPQATSDKLIDKTNSSPTTPSKKEVLQKKDQKKRPKTDKSAKDKKSNDEDLDKQKQIEPKKATQKTKKRKAVKKTTKKQVIATDNPDIKIIVYPKDSNKSRSNHYQK